MWWLSFIFFFFFFPFMLILFHTFAYRKLRDGYASCSFCSSPIFFCIVSGSEVRGFYCWCYNDGNTTRKKIPCRMTLQPRRQLQPISQTTIYALKLTTKSSSFYSLVNSDININATYAE